MHAIIHIGSPKAGSTALQVALYRNREALADAGILLCPGGPRNIANAYTDPRRKLVPHERAEFTSIAEAMDASRRTLDEFIATLQRRKPEIALFSSEHLMLIEDKAAFIDFLEAHFERITLVAYIRDPQSFYPSALDQQIRGGYKLRQLPLPTTFAYRFHEHLNAYRALVGAGNMVVRNFERGNLAGGDILVDFQAVMQDLTGREVPLEAPGFTRNQSLPAIASLWLLSVNEEFNLRDPETDVAIVARRFETIRAIRDNPALQDLPRLRLTHPPLVQALRQATHAACEELNEVFFQGQQTFPVGDGGTPPPNPVLRAELKTWLTSYAEDAAALRRFFAAHMPERRPPAPPKP